LNKALLAPIVALFCLLLKQVFGISLDDSMLNTATDGLLAIITMAGIFMDPKHQEDNDDDLEP
jgi:hypothetical protein